MYTEKKGVKRCRGGVCLCVDKSESSSQEGTKQVIKKKELGFGDSNGRLEEEEEEVAWRESGGMGGSV